MVPEPSHPRRDGQRRHGLWSATTVVAYETWIGGKPKNRHQQGKPVVHGKGHPRQGPDRKTPVLSLINKQTGEVRSKVVPTITGRVLRSAIADQVHMASTHLQTDSAAAYRTFADEFASHETVDHTANEYVRGNVSTNQAEGYFSQLKRRFGFHRGVIVGSRSQLGRPA
jgi:hypothetical protein